MVRAFLCANCRLGSDFKIEMLFIQHFANFQCHGTVILPVPSLDQYIAVALLRAVVG